MTRDGERGLSVTDVRSSPIDVKLSAPSNMRIIFEEA